MIALVPTPSRTKLPENGSQLPVADRSGTHRRMTTTNVNGFTVRRAPRQPQRPTDHRCERPSWRVPHWTPHLAALTIPLILACFA